VTPAVIAEREQQLDILKKQRIGAAAAARRWPGVLITVTSA